MKGGKKMIRRKRMLIILLIVLSLVLSALNGCEKECKPGDRRYQIFKDNGIEVGVTGEECAKDGTRWTNIGVNYAVRVRRRPGGACNYSLPWVMYVEERDDRAIYELYHCVNNTWQQEQTWEILKVVDILPKPADYAVCTYRIVKYKDGKHKLFHRVAEGWKYLGEWKEPLKPIEVFKNIRIGFESSATNAEIGDEVRKILGKIDAITGFLDKGETEKAIEKKEDLLKELNELSKIITDLIEQKHFAITMSVSITDVIGFLEDDIKREKEEIKK
jgi:hypothetical protein